MRYWDFSLKNIQNPYATNGQIEIKSVQVPSLVSTSFLVEFKAKGITACGHGDSFSANLSLVKALAEAFERFVWLSEVASLDQARNTNGFASGSSIPTAITRSRAELIEREVVLRAWSLQTGWEQVNYTGLANRLAVFEMAARGWKVHFFKINNSTDLSVVTIIAVHKEFGTIFDSVAVSNIDTSTFEKLISNALRSVFFNMQNCNFEMKPTELKAPMDHALFYCNPKNSVAFEFLSSQKSTKPVGIDDTDGINTDLLWLKMGDPVVALSRNGKWEPLSWGHRSNSKWPHPIA